MSDTLKAFFPDEDESTSQVVDRSSLEAWAVCPRQAKLMENINPCPSLPAESGQGVHDAYGEAISAYIDTGGTMGPRDLHDEIMMNLRGSRPDIQPDVLDGGGRMAYELSQQIIRIGLSNILRWDGGRGDESGQLSWEVPTLGVRLTSEVDLLYKTGDETCLCEIDYKSGWKPWTATQVAASFQFQCHAVLVLENYPEIEALAINVWMPRKRKTTGFVNFPRAFLHGYKTRVQAAAGEMVRWQEADAEDTPAWPLQDKCRICEAISKCTVDNLPASDEDIDRDPSRYVDALIVSEERKTVMKGYVSINGPIRSSDGLTEFGRDKPPSGIAKPFALYEAPK